MNPGNDTAAANPNARDVGPRVFSVLGAVAGGDVYLRDPSTARLAEFFERKGVAALKEEDQREQWYADWLGYQAEHRIYATLLAPRRHSTIGGQLDLLKLTRFLEVFAYFSPAHGYSFQVTFLGFFSILMGTNDALKAEATATLEAGGLLAFGVSEQQHGSDLLGNEFTVISDALGKLTAQGKKYYIGNANEASIIAILARKEHDRAARGARRAEPLLFALRPRQSKGFGQARKIRTLGVRAAFVGQFEIKEHALSAGDVIAEGRGAWDAVLGTVTLGKFFLGFGSIGICEHALAEAAAHLGHRILYGKPAIQMPHLRLLVAQAYARLAAMKLYAYRALDYVQAASAEERRYLLFCAVQKAKVSTEGVRVMSILSECMGAKGFEADGYFEMALRDVQLIPGLEGSTHINLGMTSQFIPGYFSPGQTELPEPPSLSGGQVEPTENRYLMEARSTGVNKIAFAPFLKAYERLRKVANVRLFARQAAGFARVVAGERAKELLASGTPTALAMGHCLATIAYGQLIAENAVRFSIEPAMVSAMFHALVGDLSAAALALAGMPSVDVGSRKLLRRIAAAPRTRSQEWDFVGERVARFNGLG